MYGHQMCRSLWSEHRLSRQSATGRDHQALSHTLHSSPPQEHESHAPEHVLHLPNGKTKTGQTTIDRHASGGTSERFCSGLFAAAMSSMTLFGVSMLLTAWPEIGDVALVCSHH